MVSSRLEECGKADAQFLSGILEACSSLSREVSSSCDLVCHSWGPFKALLPYSCIDPSQPDLQRVASCEAESIPPFRQSRWKRMCWSMSAPWHAGGAL